MRFFKGLILALIVVLTVAPIAFGQTVGPPSVELNTAIVAMATWLLTAAFKKWKPFPNDMLLHVAFWIAQVAAYAQAILQGVASQVAQTAFGSIAWAQEVPKAVTTAAGPDSVQAGAVAFMVVSLYEVIARKILWKRVFAPLLKGFA